MILESRSREFRLWHWKYGIPDMDIWDATFAGQLGLDDTNGTNTVGYQEESRDLAVDLADGVQD